MARPTLRLALAVLKHVGLGLAVLIGVAAPWSALVVLNLRASPDTPWALPAGVAYVFAAIVYLNGVGWPRSTSATRKRYLRAQPLALLEFSWSLIAGFAAVAALWLSFAATGYLFAEQAQRPQTNVPVVFLLGAIVIGAAVTALAEEGGLRGFMQVPLEYLIGPAPAIVTTSVLFVLIHLSHGVAALIRNGPFYFAAGCVYGLLAYLSQSILPSFLLHFLGDLLVFGLRSSVVHLASPPSAGIRASLIVFALLLACTSEIAFLRLARLTADKRSHLGIREAAV
jgi:membrane protease YdiL (CAAX protease family)